MNITSKNMLKYLLIITGTIITLMIVVIFMFINFSFNDMCGNEIFQSIVSPNKEYKVIVFQRDCGATTGFSTQISVLKAYKNLPNEAGNIFIANGHPDYHPVKITWIEDQKIIIQENFSESFLRNTTYKHIKIIYR